MRPLALILVCVATLAAESAADFVDRLRRLQYRGEAETVAGLIAPVSIGLVIGKSQDANRHNCRRIAAGVYGWEAVAVAEHGRAAIALLHIAQTDDNPGQRLVAFACLHGPEGWRYLPNPTAWDAWYHRLPAQAADDFAHLEPWLQRQLEEHAGRTTGDPAATIRAWLQAMTGDLEDES